LGQLVDVLDHKRVPVSAKERASRSGEVPYYGAAGQVGWIDKPLFDEPRLLLGEDGVQFFDPAKSKAYVIDGPAWVNNHAHVLRARHDLVERRFLMYYLNWTDFHGFANGTTRLKLTKSAMTSMPIPLPSLGEQRRIIEILEDHLSRLDAARSALAAAQRRRDAWLDAMLDRAVAGSWAEKLIREVAVVGSGATPLRSRTDYYENGAVPWVTSGALNDSFITSPTSYITETALRETAAKVWPVGTLLVAMYGEGRTRGRCSELAIASTTNQACAAILMKEEHKALQTWIKLVLQSSYQRMRRMASGGVQPNLSLGLIRGMSIPIPPDEVRDASIDSVRRVDEAAARLRLALSTAMQREQGLRAALLSAAFSGSLTARNFDTEAIEELASV